MAGPEYNSSIDALDNYFNNMTDVTGAWHMAGGGSSWVNSYLDYSHSCFENGGEASISDFENKVNTSSNNGSITIQTGVLDTYMWWHFKGEKTWHQGNYLNSKPIYSTIQVAAGGGDKPDGMVLSFSFDFAFGGGAGFEIGLVTDKNGGRNLYISGSANIGYGISAGPNIRSIQSMPGSTFEATDYQGYSNGINIGIGSLGYSNAGDKNSGQWSYDGLFNYGKSYIEKGGGYSFFSNAPTYGVIWSNTSTKLKLRK